jgi:O-antigen/teichoic acid export membrane protein
MKSSVKAGTFYLTIAQVVFASTSYVIQVLTGRVLGPVDYGTLGLVMGFVNLIRGVILNAVPTAVSKYIAEDRRTADIVRVKGVRLQLACAVVVFVIYFGLAGRLAIVLQDAAISYYLRLSSLVLPFFAIYFVQLHVLNGLRDFRGQARTIIIYSSSRLMLVVAAILIFGSLKAVLVAIVLLNVLMSLAAVPLFRARRPADRPDFGYHTLWRFAAPVMLSSVGITLLLGSDIFFVKALLASDEVLGFYTAARTVSQVPIFLFAPMAMTIFPTVSEVHHRGDSESTREQAAAMFRYAALAVTPFAALTSGTATTIMTLIYSERFSDGGSALRVLIVGTSLLALFFVLSNVISASGKPRVAAILAFCALPVNILLQLGLVPAYGIVGAAFAATATYALLLVMAWGYLHHRFGPLATAASVGKIICAGLALFVVGYLVEASTRAVVAIWLVLLLAYGVAMYRTRDTMANNPRLE